MRKRLPLFRPARVTLLLRWSAVLLLVLSAAAGRAQSPTWQAALAADSYLNGSLLPAATVADAAGNVYVAGSFFGQVTIGSAQLSSAGQYDAFVAKWNPTTGSFTWVVTAGGKNDDLAAGLALSGNALYVAGYFTNDAANNGAVLFGQTTVAGKSAQLSSDVFVAKLTDAGATAGFNWVTAAGGSGSDRATAVAVSGTAVYVAGSLQNNASNANGVSFGTLSVPGKAAATSLDLFTAKLTDSGTAGTFAWALAAGGTNEDSAAALAVSGSSVYVTGNFYNNAADDNAVRFGTLPLAGVGMYVYYDIFVAKLTDAGSSASFTWALAAGGEGYEGGQGIVVGSNGIYLTGYFSNTTANLLNTTFGAAGTLYGTSSTTYTQDIFVAKLTDAGSSADFVWARAAGGRQYDYGTGIAVVGANVYVTGYYENDSANGNGVTFGNLGAVPGTSTAVSRDAFVGRLTDTGAAATWTWLQRAGGGGLDAAAGLAVVGSAIYTTGRFDNKADFGSAAGSPLNSGGNTNLYVGQLTETGSGAAWARVSQTDTGGSLTVQAVAADANGDVVVAGSFSGYARLGATTLTGTGILDIFVAKWNTASSTWAWALSAGGLGVDQAAAVAISGTSIYVAGQFNNSTTNGQLVAFGALPLNGVSVQNGYDVFVAKATDAGTTASWTWTQAAGGNSPDQATALAVGNGAIYVAGGVGNPLAGGVAFGSLQVTGLKGDQDAFVAKLVDAGTTAGFTWVLPAGGNGSDRAAALAVGSNGVYVSGYFVNNTTDITATTFGSQSLPGLSPNNTSDIFVAKLTDAGASGSFTWARAGGGAGLDGATAVAVSGSSVYVAGYVANSSGNINNVSFAGLLLNGASAIKSSDIFVAKLTDTGPAATAGWALAAGGNLDERALGLAANSGGVYLTGYFFNSSANANGVTFGASTLAGVATDISRDGFLARVTDAGGSGTFAWVKAVGGAGADQCSGVVARGAQVYVGGTVGGTAVLDNRFLLTSPYGTPLAFAASLTDTYSPLAASLAQAEASLHLYPNPAREQATLTGLAARAPWTVLDVLGRPVLTGAADAQGTARLLLPPGLAAGLYLVRASEQTLRLRVE